MIIRAHLKGDPEVMKIESKHCRTLSDALFFYATATEAERREDAGAVARFAIYMNADPVWRNRLTDWRREQGRALNEPPAPLVLDETLPTPKVLHVFQPYSTEPGETGPGAVAEAPPIHSH